MCRLQKTIYNWALFKGCIGLVLSLPMRDGNEAAELEAIRAMRRSEPTYEGWKLSQPEAQELPLASSEPTYEGWK